VEELELRGHLGLPLPAVLHGDASRCALVLPGAGRSAGRIGGTPARPDLHFTRALLQEQGCSVLELWWDSETLDRDAPDGWLLDNARAGIEGIRELGREPAVLVGRSLGTSALARLRAAEPQLARLPSIWIAPLLPHEPVRESLLHGGGACFVLCGGRDEAYDAGVATLLHRRGADVVVLEHADHGLDCGDAPASARGLADALERMRDFLRRADAT
jgi:hypothetical protein